MGFHTFDVDRADALEEESRYRHCSREELHALVAPFEGMALADLGSGTGFYTDDLAPAVGTLYAVDVQEAMHDLYREKGVPENVALVAADVESLPFEDDALDGAISTKTYHEFASEGALAEIARVVRPGGRVVTIDWARSGEGEAGPPRAERYDVDHAVTRFIEAGFGVERAESRRETFVCACRLKV